MNKLIHDDATKALKTIEEYCDQSLEAISEELKSVKEEQFRIEPMDRYAKIKQARDFALNTFTSLLGSINAK